MRLTDIPVLSGGNWLGHLAEFKRDRFRLLARVNRECDGIGRIRAMDASIVFVNSPELLHELLVEHARSFVKSPGLRGPLTPLAGQGLFTSEGDLWRRQRRLMAPLFTQAQIEAYAGAMAACAHDAAAALRPGQVLDAARVTTHIAMRIAGKTLFGIDTLDEADELGAALTAALDWVNDRAGHPTVAAQLRAASAVQAVSRRLPEPLPARGSALAERMIVPIRWPGESTRRLDAALETIERRVARMISDRRASGEARNDLLSLLLEAHDEDGARMTDKQVRDEIVTLFIAGHETTAAALAWSLYLLGRHPEAHARAKREARRITGMWGLDPAAPDAAPPPPGRLPGAGDLPALSFCLQVFKESMRLYPPIYLFGRQAITDVTLGGYELPAGTIVLVCPLTLHHNPRVWPDPERFEPSRFEPAAEAARHRQAFLPFSAGPRTCIGNHFALMEGPLVLATLLGRLDFELATDAIIEPTPSATLRPRGGVPVRITAVAPAQA